MKLFSAVDVEAAVRKAYGQCTHVIMNRGYTLIKPVFFRTDRISDLPLYQYASWLQQAGDRQVADWQTHGGILIEQDTEPKVKLEPDVTVMVECPYDMRRIEMCNRRNLGYGVIPHPKVWHVHTDCINMRRPEVSLLQDLWRLCGGRNMSNTELSIASGIPTLRLQYIKNALKPKEHWSIQKRLAPEQDSLIPAWDWLGDGGEFAKSEIAESGFVRFIEELAKFGYVKLTKVQHYPSEEPDWKRLKEKREKALASLAEVRSLVESLPDHSQA